LKKPGIAATKNIVACSNPQATFANVAFHFQLEKVSPESLQNKTICGTMAGFFKLFKK